MSKRMGILYIVTNDINEKVYIGKTYKTLIQRWNGHKTDSQKEDKQYKFYRAIRKYGIERFEIKELGRFEEGLLEEKEIEYIEKYDSFKNGYNSTLGGDGNRRIFFTDSDIKYICDNYLSGVSITKLADMYDCKREFISNILKSNNVEIYTLITPIKMVMYDKYFNIEKIFECKFDVFNYLEENTDYKLNVGCCFNNIKNSSKEGCVRYNHRWQEYQSLILEDDGVEMLFRTSFEKEKYLEDKTVHIELKDGFYIIPGYLEEKFNLNVVKIDRTICPRCGKKKYYLSEICQECRNELNEIRSEKKKQAKNILLKFKDISHLTINYNRDKFKGKNINHIDILIKGFLLSLEINNRYKLIQDLFNQNKSELKVKYINNHKIIIDIHVYKVRRKENIKKLCPICNKNKLTRGSKMCIDCYKKQQTKNIPPKEELEKYLSEGLSMVAISKIYGKTDKTVSKWLKKYGLYKPKLKKSTIDNNNYPCKIVKDDFEKEFNSISEVSQWLIDNEYSNDKVNRLNYSLKQIIDTNKRCGGFYIKSN